MTLLRRFQREFETLYDTRLDPEIRIDDYLMLSDEAEIDEVLYLRESGEGSLEVALFLGQRILRHLQKYRPWKQLGSFNLEAFCTVIEGTSHFFTVMARAAEELPVSRLELELQAEVDKFLFCFFYLESQGNPTSSSELRTALFESYRLLPHLTSEQRERYELANRLAFRYCKSLDGLTVPSCRLKLLNEIRRFRQLGLEEKIRQAA